MSDVRSIESPLGWTLDIVVVFEVDGVLSISKVLHEATERPDGRTDLVMQPERVWSDTLTQPDGHSTAHSSCQTMTMFSHSFGSTISLSRFNVATAPSSTLLSSIGASNEGEELSSGAEAKNTQHPSANSPMLPKESLSKKAVCWRRGGFTVQCWSSSNDVVTGGCTLVGPPIAARWHWSRAGRVSRVGSGRIGMVSSG